MKSRFCLFIIVVLYGCTPVAMEVPGIVKEADYVAYYTANNSILFSGADNSFSLCICEPSFLDSSAQMKTGSYLFGGNSYYEERQEENLSPVQYIVSGSVQVSESPDEDTGYTVRISFTINNSKFTVLASSSCSTVRPTEGPHEFSPKEMTVGYHGGYYAGYLGKTSLVYVVSLNDPESETELLLELYTYTYNHGAIPTGRFKLDKSRSGGTALSGHKYQDSIMGCHLGSRLFESGEIIISCTGNLFTVSVLSSEFVASYTCPAEFVDCLDPALMAKGEPDIVTSENWTIKGQGEYYYLGTGTAAYYDKLSHEYILDLSDSYGRNGMFLLLYSPEGDDLSLPSSGKYIIVDSANPFTASTGHCYDAENAYPSLIYKYYSSGKLESWWMLKSGTITFNKSGSSYIITVIATTAKGSSVNITYTGTINKGKAA